MEKILWERSLVEFESMEKLFFVMMFLLKSLRYCNLLNYISFKVCWEKNCENDGEIYYIKKFFVVMFCIIEIVGVEECYFVVDGKV